VTGLDALIPGANVAFNLGAGATAGTVAVGGITALGTTSVFAGNNAFPAINGQFVSFNSSTGMVTLDTTTAGRLTFPVAGNVANAFTGLPRGANLNFGFDVTNGQPQTGATTFTPAPIVNITGFQPLTTVAGAAGPIPGTTIGAVPAVLPAGTVGGQTVGATPVSNTVGGFAVGGATGANGTAAPGGSGTVGGDGGRRRHGRQRDRRPGRERYRGRDGGRRHDGDGRDGGDHGHRHRRWPGRGRRDGRGLALPQPGTEHPVRDSYVRSGAPSRRGEGALVPGRGGHDAGPGRA
jgi:hypothetical protein